MPEKPRSVGGVMVVGVGDPKVGKFIDGRQSRQDVSTLRQIALRLGGEYHDGNEKHLPTAMINRLTSVENESPFEKLTRREYALIACGVGAGALAFLPVLLAHFGTAWSPGVKGRRAVPPQGQVLRA
jgi:Ca-activated chloride channel family protein